METYIFHNLHDKTSDLQCEDAKRCLQVIASCLPTEPDLTGNCQFALLTLGCCIGMSTAAH